MRAQRAKYLSDGRQAHYVPVFQRRENALVLERLRVHANHEHVVKLCYKGPDDGVGALEHLNEVNLRILSALNHLLGTIMEEMRQSIKSCLKKHNQKVHYRIRLHK